MPFTQIKPPIRWVGGKTQLLSQLCQGVPDFKTYHEPFCGGAALFFHLKPSRAYVSDMNPKLINFYACLKNNKDKLLEEIMGFKGTKEEYYNQRALLNAEKNLPNVDDCKAAARFYLMNRRGYNGLWRENTEGMYNTPFNGSALPIMTKQKLESFNECHRVLQRASLSCSSFENVVDRAEEDDLVYFDPPYVAVKEGSFDSYIAGGVDDVFQQSLRDVSKELISKGVHVMLSNSDVDRVRDLYADPCFNVRSVKAKRSVNSDPKGRGLVSEVIVTSWRL